MFLKLTEFFTKNPVIVSVETISTIETIDGITHIVVIGNRSTVRVVESESRISKALEELYLTIKCCGVL